MNEWLVALGYGVVNVVLVLALAPLFEGVIRKITARVQSRIGPPLLQPYFDLMKLLGKEDLECGESPLMQRLVAYLSLASILTAAALIPMGGTTPLNEVGDITLLIYALTLCGITTLLAGLAAGSTYSLLGMSREMMAMMALEPLLAIALIVGAIHAKSLRLDEVLMNGAVYQQTLGLPVAGVAMMIISLLALQAFVGRLPFDTAEAETEIMEGPLMEYSGPKLALFKLARMVKLVVYAALLLALFVPWGNQLFYPLSIIVLLAKILVLVLLVTLVAATHARYRIDQALRYYLGLFGVALVVLVFAVCGW